MSRNTLGEGYYLLRAIGGTIFSRARFSICFAEVGSFAAAVAGGPPQPINRRKGRINPPILAPVVSLVIGLQGPHTHWVCRIAAFAHRGLRLERF